MRILLIEDDQIIAKLIHNALINEGFVCDIISLGEEGLEIGKIYEYDLIMLDLMLPDIDGYDVLRRFRTSLIQTPILVISGLNSIEDKVKGLGFGADDYITKPFNKSELIARAHAVVRRSKGHSESIIRLGRLVINLQNRTASVDGVIINLTTKEYSILELLALRKGTTLGKEMFLSHLYGGIDEPELKIIDVFICKLRRKIDKALGFNTDCIQTVWGRGYVLNETNITSVASAKSRRKLLNNSI